MPITPPTVPDPDNETIAAGLPLGLKVFLAVIGAIVLGLAMLHHLTGGFLGSHGH